jgi:hypothetical protein
MVLFVSTLLWGVLGISQFIDFCHQVNQYARQLINGVWGRIGGLFFESLQRGERSASALSVHLLRLPLVDAVGRRALTRLSVHAREKS